MIYNSVEEIIGGTPLLKLNKIKEEYDINAVIFAKLELFNPTGSAKDRAALYMLNEAEKKGLIREGATIIEPTSGNTGIGLASICTQRGYKCIIVMPDTMSVERIKLMRAYGAEVMLSKGSLGMSGAIALAEELRDKTENSFIPGQFDNPDNALAHYATTGPEIYKDLEGRVDVLVAGIGTGGTITGTAKYLKEKNPGVKVVGIEPASSPLITKGIASSHGIQGIGANFIPKVLDISLVDEVLTVTDEEAFEMTRLLGTKEGIMVGISAGAALSGALLTAKRTENANKNIVVILPDSGDRYLSTDLF